MKSAGGVQNGFVLRLSVPASGDLAAVGQEMAVKLAEQLGIAPPHASRVGDAIRELAGRVDPSGDHDVSFEFQKLEAELTIEARQGDRTAETRVPLSA